MTESQLAILDALLDEKRMTFIRMSILNRSWRKTLSRLDREGLVRVLPRAEAIELTPEGRVLARRERQRAETQAALAEIPAWIHNLPHNRQL